MRSAMGLTCGIVLLAAACAAPVEHGPSITAAPDGSSIGTPVAVTVDGLAPGDAVRVWARTHDRMGQRWESSGEFVADGVGRVEVATSASTGGTYQGIDPHGLFWSMRLSEQQQPPYPLLGADDVVVELGVDRAGETLARTSLRRVVRDPDGRVVSIAEAGLVGDLYLPPGPGPGPGGLLLGGSGGGRPDPAYAAVIAAQGFAVLGLAYFGEAGLPRTLTRIPVEYGLAGARWLADRPEVVGDRVGVVGTSKGAEYALLLASSEPGRFAAVVAHVPSDLVWPALGDPGPGQVSSWTRDGEDVPFLAFSPASDQELATPPAPGQPVRVADAYAAAVAGATPRRLAAARIPVERIAAPVLVTSGGDDGIWPSTPQAERVLAAIAEAGNPHGSRHLDFPRAGHGVGGVPDLPATRTAVASGPLLLEAGGDPAATAAAVRSTFPATLDLLHRALPL